MALSKLIFCLALVLLLLTYRQNKVVLGGENGSTRRMITVTKSISFPDFKSWRVNHHDLRLLGSAKVSKKRNNIQIPDPTEKNDIRHQAGRAIYSSPIRVFDPNSQTPASFDTTFAFQFNNHTALGSNHDSHSELSHGGSGLTFLIAPDEFTVGRPGAWLGMLNDACNEGYYKFIAIEFDTRQNLEFGDPNDNHIGIDLGSIVSRTTINASQYGLAFEDGSVHWARISYDGPSKRMEIGVGSNSHSSLRSVFSNKIDLSPFLNEYMFVGFSASTGNRAQIHNILSWNFTSTSRAFLMFPSTETCEDKILFARHSNDGDNNGVTSKKKGLSTNFLIFIRVMVLCLAILLNLYCNRRRSSSNNGSSFLVLPEKKHRPTPPNRPRRFTGAELSLATKGFSNWEVLGGDSSGVLYKGTLHNGCHVAIKRLSAPLLAYMGMDRRRFLKRAGSLSRVRHPSLVPIRGWCYDNKEFMVVYEYMFNGCLDKWLFGVGVLPWNRRFKVVKNVANGLNYLHSHQLAHNNVQVSSVFLDVSFKALLGDFGFGDPVGRDPASSWSIDVFNFGIFVLEVVAGRRRKVSETDPNGSGEEDMDLLDYAWIMQEKDEKIKMVDKRMGSGVDPDQAIRVIEVALLCTLPETNGRPKMEDVARYLNTDGPMPELPPNRPIVFISSHLISSLPQCPIIRLPPRRGKGGSDVRSLTPVKTERLP